MSERKKLKVVSSIGAREEARTGQASAGSPALAVPEPEVRALPKRRQFSAAYKRSVLEEADRGVDVPTIAEAGMPGYEMSPWIGVFAPAGTPKPTIDKFNAEINKALKLPDAAQSLSSHALDPWLSTPAEFGERLKADYDKYALLIKLTGARID